MHWSKGLLIAGNWVRPTRLLVVQERMGSSRASRRHLWTAKSGAMLE